MVVFNYLIYLLEVVSFKALYYLVKMFVCYINCRVDCCFGRRERWSFSLKLKKTIKWEVQEQECLTFCEEKICLHWSQLKLNLDHKNAPTCESNVRRLLQTLLTVPGWAHLLYLIKLFAIAILTCCIWFFVTFTHSVFLFIHLVASSINFHHIYVKHLIQRASLNCVTFVVLVTWMFYF